MIRVVRGVTVDLFLWFSVTLSPSVLKSVRGIGAGRVRVGVANIGL